MTEAVANYSKNSMPVLRVDAHFTVIESALKGYVKWRRSHNDEDEGVINFLVNNYRNIYLT